MTPTSRYALVNVAEAAWFCPITAFIVGYMVVVYIIM